MTESATAALAPGHQTMLLAHRAMVRDLERIGRAARELPAGNAERATALRDYVDRISQLIEHHHEGEDDFLWPKLRERGADEEALALMTAEHEDLTKVLHVWHATSRRLGSDEAAPAELATQTDTLREQLAQHAGDEERELTGRLAPALDKGVWKGFATHMRKTAPGWTLRFMPAWLLSVATPAERGGVPGAPIGRLFSGWLEKNRRAAFGDTY
ncbi:hemerythrin domain-containing protein [Streptomyces tubbatahanensis]|uniref:Hemerythrin domain-containing protein n=1 Tax=Streptomyces tubbatahanensis TaxID=2923272 RepID=A0ABY3XX71_9ACTN|nr:hemerythrin domain-containing protein [Streptomyces tubbatahanensis]UNS99101.1 hemerythrin domain-containing protein [Streptomyces tubbatahanensis]